MPAYNALDLAGKTFNRLTALKRAPYKGKKRADWICQCACGKTSTVDAWKLKSGRTKSCGCWHMERAQKELWTIQRTHGLTRTLTASSWTMMKNRTENERFPSFSRYGGRGIKACGFLKHSPWSIIITIGQRPTREFSIDRINNDGGYTCGACWDCLNDGKILNIRWSTNLQQQRNKSSNHLIEIGGQFKCSTEWAELLKIDRHTVVRRYSKKVIDTKREERVLSCA